MPITHLAECAETLKLHYTGEDVHFASVSIDTRTLKEGELFIAIKGDQWDGHDFIEAAYEKKAVAIMSEIPITIPIPYLKVPNTRIALGLLAQHHRRHFSLPIIALTGSCGKTTTKEYLRSILSHSGPVLAPSKSFNNDIGVPLTLLNLTKHHQFAVLEMGANAPGEIAWLTEISKPSIAGILNIAPAHLEGFGSIEQVAKAKSEIFKGLSKADIAILPIDFKMRWSSYIPNQKTIYFGQTSKADVYAASVRLKDNQRISFTLVSQKGEITINLPLPGKHQVDNALAAAAMALAIDISLAQIKAGLESTQGIPNRLRINTIQHYGTIIDDTYNANPKSVRAALELLASYPKPRVLVLGDMGELGKESDYYHGLVGQWAKQLEIQKILAYGSFSKRTVQVFGEGGHHFESQTHLIQTLSSQLNNGYTTLVKGSRCMEMEKIVEALLAKPM